MDKIDEAASTYQEGLKVDPNNEQLKKDLKAAEDKKNEKENPQ